MNRHYWAMNMGDPVSRVVREWFESGEAGIGKSPCVECSPRCKGCPEASPFLLTYDESANSNMPLAFILVGFGFPRHTK